MARYAYDVNTTQRYIDVHKQFQGGLKTVDTDDALGAVFLREAENVSISEFGFLEKRYGTYENFKRNMPTGATNLQGYWEFEGYIIYAVDGDIFVNGTRIETFHTEPGLRYPTNDNIPFISFTDFEIQTTTTCEFEDDGFRIFENTPTDPSTNPLCGEADEKIGPCYDDGPNYWVCDITKIIATTTTTTVPTGVTIVDHFQRDRDMNAVNINRVLYIFTGTYPIYAKLVSTVNFPSGELKFYLFPVNIPTFDEIVVTGHNLLEDDYEGLYFPEPQTYSPNGLSSGTIEKPIELRKVDGKIQSNFAPKIPFADNGVIDFKFQYVIDEKYTLTDFNPANNKNKYTEIGLDSIQYRNSGIGASDLDFINLDISSINFPVKNNYIGSQNINLIRGFDLLSKQLSSQELDISISASQAPGFADYEFDFSISDDFTKEIFLENKTKIYTVEYNTGDAFNPYDVFKFDIDFFKEKFGLSAIPNGRFAITYSLEVIPLDSDGLEYPDLKVVYSSSELEFLGVGYNFVLPSTLAAPDAITKYRLNFNGFVGFSLSLAESQDYNAPETFRKRVSYAEKILILNEDQQIQNFPDLSVQISNLLSGTYDFKINYYFKSFSYENGILGIFNTEDGVKIGSLSFYNITITAEKLQDFPRKDANSIGIEYPTLKPIWTCNKVIEHFGKLMVWGSTAMPTAVFYSFPDRPTYFPSKFFLDFTNDQNSPVEAVSSYMNILVVQTRDQTWGIRGNSGLLTAPAPYAPFTINPTVGTIAYKSVRAVRNHLFFLSKQGIIALKSLYAADEQYNIEFVDRNILNIVPRDDDKAVGIQFDNQYWLNFPKQRITLRWYIDKKAWVKDTYGAWDDFNGVFKYQIVDGKLEFITQPSLFEGENLGIYKIGVDYSLPTDLGADIVALFETAFLNQNYPFHPKNYKETKMDFTVQNEYNLGRDPIYTMETNEDINENQTLHTIVAPSLIKNHRYQLKYEAYIINGGDFGDTPTADVDAGTFNNNPTSFIDAMETYTLDEGAINLHSTTIPFTETSENTYEFLLANNVPIGQDLTIARQFIGYEGGAILLDITYDHVLDFRTWIISEDNTLNLDNMEGYDQSKAEIPIQLGAKFGDWVFGLSDLGNKVTAIKTIKLAGRGYNVKVYFEDYSKSKWTLESLGITYKMKRPRSR